MLQILCKLRQELPPFVERSKAPVRVFVPIKLMNAAQINRLFPIIT